MGGSLTMKNGKIDKFLFGGGYAQASVASSTTDNFAFYYYNQDHLGNIREVVNASGSVQQVTNYYPFGAPYADAAGSSNPDFQPYKYNGKELDKMHGLNTYDYGARQYDPTLCRLNKLDRFCERNFSNSPYNYCADNPIISIDVNGDSCIVLLAPDGANGYGHMAIGIQNSEGEWCLYSKNGTNEHFGLYGEEPPIGDPKHNDRGEKKADNLYEFLHNTSINPKDENDKPEYTEGFLIATTPEQDEKMKGGALDVLNQDYDVLSSNCAQTVLRALEYGGLNPGNGLRPKKNVYPSIVKNNKEAQILIYNPQLPPKEW